ncbi:hypothetical protein C173_14660 [Paenibacillus sp. FSL R7-277]|uniref:glycosyltransferase n=1 Tax=Paenibacillus sp. FSL R7-277 TaxID=1227352 RepID=UPI0003E2749B|nr:glycosyltransferase [Paenibacillus sp. FSL R7-277]ETT72289.1 hypothetical protein C173_14660 [Paenibacillus sp. FSL R7-277]
MKILLIGFTKIAYMPYMNFYLNQFYKEDNEIHLLYWNRDGKKEIQLPNKVKLHEFKMLQEDEVPKIKKLRSFSKYRKNAKKLLMKNKFDLVVVMHTLPGVLLNDTLEKHYSKKYILDYRDVTFESFKFYKKLIHKLVKNSIATFVSSDAFRIYLPVLDYIYTSHNILIDSLDYRDIRRNESRIVKPIRIRYWGFIRHESINKTIIDRVANDERFELHYHGREQETAHNLKRYCETKSIDNVYFHGEYKPVERYGFAKNTEIIHNMYENDKMTQPAMANKYYDGLIFYIPQLCNEGSFMGGRVAHSKIGFICNPNNISFADDLFNYYNSISWSTFVQSCDHELDDILSEYKKGANKIQNIINS